MRIKDKPNPEPGPQQGICEVPPHLFLQQYFRDNTVQDPTRLSTSELSHHPRLFSAKAMHEAQWQAGWPRSQLQRQQSTHARLAEGQRSKECSNHTVCSMASRCKTCLRETRQYISTQHTALQPQVTWKASKKNLKAHCQHHWQHPTLSGSTLQFSCERGTEAGQFLAKAHPDSSG